IRKALTSPRRHDKLETNYHGRKIVRAAEWITIATMALAAPQATAAETPSQAALDRLADTLGYRLTMVDNGPECPAGIDGCFLTTITLTLPETLPTDTP